MSRKPIEDVLARIEGTIGTWGRGTSLEDMRNGFAQLISAGRRPERLDVDADGVAAAWFGDPNAEGVLFYCHGGGYQMGSLVSHGPLMEDFAEAAGIRVLGFDYRLAPEHRFPAALDDSMTVYRWLLDQGVSPRKLAIAGDSAGAGLALATLLKARSEGLKLPAKAVFLSPWLDMEAGSDTYESRAAVDPLTQRGKVAMMARTYLGRDGDPANPLASPINGDMSGLPPMLVHVGDHETVLGDSLLLSERAGAVGVPVDLVVWDDMIHHFQVFPELEEARKSVKQIGAHLRAALS